MTESIGGTVILFFIMYLYSHDFVYSFTFSLGSVAFYVLVEKKPIEDLHLTASKWISNSFMAAILGLFYTIFIVICITMIGSFVFSMDGVLFSPILLVVALFVPHGIFFIWNKFRGKD